MKNSKVELYKEPNGGYRWRMVSPNGRLILSPEKVFRSKQALQKSVEAIASVFAAGAFVVSDLIPKNKTGRKPKS